MPKVSVIVPIYKAEKYLNRCLDSILAQTMADFELLLIDDGSPDRSGEICDEYAKKDSRIRVFHQENGGVASARQLGIDNAKGEYSIHADPDDWVEPDMLKEMYGEAKRHDADMVIADYYYETTGGQKYYTQKPKTLDNDCIIEQLISGEIHGSTCNKLVRTELYARHNVHFPLNMTCMEDTFVICSLLMHNIRVEYIPQAFYHYDAVINENSLTYHTGKKIKKTTIDSIVYFIDYFDEHLFSKEYFKDALIKRKWNSKLMMWSCHLYSRKYFVSKYPEINKLALEKYNAGKLKGYRSFVFMLNKGWLIYYILFFLNVIREKILR